MGDKELDVPVEYGTNLLVNGPTKAALAELVEELRGTGVTVSGIYIAEQDAPPRFFIQFPPDMLSFKVRLVLEEKGWDVGQQMGNKMLKFYAAKRAVKSDGWNV